jgi:nitrite reductase/ring-hydroxylating ferredoxin subunit
MSTHGDHREAFRVAAGTLSSLEPGIVRVVPLPRGLFGAPPVVPLEALVVRDHGGTPRAYLNRCRHLPIPLSFGRPTGRSLYDASHEFLTRDNQALECKTHGARYRLDDGMRFEGPCTGRALLALGLVVEGDEVYVVAAA